MYKEFKKFLKKKDSIKLIFTFDLSSIVSGILSMYLFITCLKRFSMN